MGIDRKWEPRTLRIDLSDINCYLFLPTMKADYTHDVPANVYVAMRARYNRKVGMFVAGQITLDGHWLSRPKINEGVYNAGYYLDQHEDVSFSDQLIKTLEDIVMNHEPFLRPVFEQNRCLAVS